MIVRSGECTYVHRRVTESTKTATKINKKQINTNKHARQNRHLSVVMATLKLGAGRSLE